MKTFEIICPVYNEEKTIPLFFQRIIALREIVHGKYDLRLTFIDNCSKDSSHQILHKICDEHDWVNTIVMSRNFGYQCSVECGLRNSNADMTGVVDVDCEDPPELFVDFLKHIEDGYDVVYGERKDREEVAFIKWLRKVYYRVNRAAADEHFILDMAEFSVITRMVREAVIADNNSFPYIRASIGRVGFEVKNVPYKRHKRIAGETHYNFWGMFVFAVAGILSSSTLWLRIPTLLFPFWVILTLTCFGVFIGTADPFFFQFLVMSGILFLGFAVTGTSLYLARVYKNGLHRPNYFINRKKSVLRGRQIN